MAQLVDTRKEGNPEGFDPNVDNSIKYAKAGTLAKVV